MSSDPSQTTAHDLKSCPFCCGPASHRDDGEGWDWVDCQRRCGYAMPCAGNDTAVQAWNRRGVQVTKGKSDTTIHERMIGRWHVMQTLIGCIDGSDINRRYLCCGFDEFRVTFNERMDPWHPDDDKALHALCRYLNEKAATDAE
jgi:hypothetical protein